MKTRSGKPAMSDSTGGSDIVPDGDRSESRPASTDRAPLTDEQRRERIEAIAYSMAERRGFQPGLALEDWLEAERQVDDEIAARFSRVSSQE